MAAIEDKYNNYHSDLVSILLDKLDDLEKEIATASEEDSIYQKGQILAYYDTLTIMRSQADLFDLPFPEVNNIERYLML